MIADLFRITRPDGIGIGIGAGMGAGPAILLRELVLFRADLRRADWFGRGAPAPRAAGPAEARFRWLSAAEWHARSDDMETPPATAAQRYKEGAGLGVISSRLRRSSSLASWRRIMRAIGAFNSLSVTLPSPSSSRVWK